jgi:hypothetical protein
MEWAIKAIGWAGLAVLACIIWLIQTIIFALVAMVRK